MKGTPPSSTGGARRSLRFENFADLRRDLDALKRGATAGTLRTVGAWTPAQNMNHVAAFMNYPFDGYPPELPGPPAVMRMAARLLKRSFLTKPLKPGMRIPGLPGGTVGVRESGVEEAIAGLRAAADRLDRSAPPLPNPVFGALTHDEWRHLNLRHAELHLSFLHP